MNEKITKEKLLRLGFRYDSYIATGNYMERAIKLFEYNIYKYNIIFEAYSPDKWNMIIEYNVNLEERHRKQSKINIIPITNMIDLKEAYKVITHIIL